MTETSSPEASAVIRRSVRVLLVDDEPAVRTGWKLRLGIEPDLEIVGEAGDGLEAVQYATQLAPDVILIDVDMPVLDGISATREIKLIAPACTVIVTTIDDNVRVRSAALEAGAAAIIAKHEPFENVLSAIRAYGRGKIED